MSSNKPTDPRMTKVEDPKSIYYQYSSLKKLLSEEDIQLMQPLKDSLKQQGQLKPQFGKCYFCKDPTHWIGDCPEAKKPRSQSAVALNRRSRHLDNVILADHQITGLQIFHVKMKWTLQVFLLQVHLRSNNRQLLLRFRHQGNASFLIPILRKLYQARK